MLRSRLFLNNNIKEKIVIRLKTDKPSNENALLNKKIYVNDSTKETAYAWEGKDIELNYDPNINISVRVDDIKQFITPNRVSFVTQKGNTRVLDFNYIKPDYGVYIMNTNEGLYEANNWENAWIRDDLGIYVLAKERKMLIASSLGYNYYSASQFYMTEVNTYNYLNEAKLDFDGKHNTNAIVKASKDIIGGNVSDWAAIICDNHTFKNGCKGYFPAMGELNMLLERGVFIQSCMEVLGTEPTGFDTTAFHSSTQYNSEYCWGYYFGSPKEVYKGDEWWFFIAADYK